MEEKWKDIKGFGGRYQVSNLGRVRSREVRARTYQGTRKVPAKIFKGFDNGNGYKVVTLRMSANKKKNFYIHRLVGEAFIPNPKNLQVINHKDFDKSNNKASNLEWLSVEQNIRYSAPRMRHPKNKCKASNTGEKYISKRKEGWFRVTIRQFNIYRRFKTLEEAKSFKEKAFAKGGDVI